MGDKKLEIFASSNPSLKNTKSLPPLPKGSYWVRRLREIEEKSILEDDSEAAPIQPPTPKVGTTNIFPEIDSKVSK